MSGNIVAIYTTNGESYHINTRDLNRNSVGEILKIVHANYNTRTVNHVDANGAQTPLTMMSERHYIIEGDKYNKVFSHGQIANVLVTK